MKAKRRNLFMAAILLLTMIAASACGVAPTPTPTAPVAVPTPEEVETPAPEPTPPPEPEELITVTEAAGWIFPGDWDPPLIIENIQFRALYHVYDTLVALDVAALQDGEVNIVPSLAESWDIDDTGTVYTFHLREGINFTTGRPLTAEAVSQVIERAVQVKEAEVVETIFRADGFFEVDSAEVIDEHTLQVTLKGPWAPFLPNLTTVWHGIYDVDEVLAHEEDGDFGHAWLNTHSAGTGAYMIEEMVPHQRIVLTRNPDYWGGPDGKQPTIDNLVFLDIPESMTQLLMLQRGEIDIARNLTPAQHELLAEDPNAQTLQYPSTYTYVAFMDAHNPPLSDVRVRQAIQYAIDREGLLETVAGGYGELHQCYYYFEGTLGYSEECNTLFTYDPERAMELLAEAGYADGFEMNLVARPQPAAVPYDKTALYIQQNLDAVGIRANVRVQEGPPSYEQLRNGELNGLVFTLGGVTYPDPHMRAANIHNLCTWGGWDQIEPEYYNRAVELEQQGVLETDPARRQEIYEEFAMIVHSRSVCSWNWMREADVLGARTNLSGLVHHPYIFGFDYRYMEKD